MSNFRFVEPVWPELFADCVRAEGYLRSDPRSACIYGRRVTERLVDYLYDVLQLPLPYRDDVNARINDASFAAKVGLGIQGKLNLVRRLGNTAAHSITPVQGGDALAVLREVHHLVIWAAFRYSDAPGAVPTSAVFDPTLAARMAPLSRDEAIALAARFREQDEAHKAELANRDDLLAKVEAENAELRERIRAAQEATTLTDLHDYTEAESRDTFIDLLLREAGWPLDQARDREFEVDGMPNASGRGFVDYVLWGADGLPLAVIEAKRTGRSPDVGEQQAKLYADALEKRFGRRPVIFLTNGYEHWIWDDAAGYPRRQVQGFYTRSELELMVQRRTTRRPLASVSVNQDIAGRHYQVRAIKAVDDALEHRKREALLVMATGSGKTRTVIALVEQLMRANWVKRVLFLADRTALVKQAARAFNEHLPSTPVVNLLQEKSRDARVFASTYPTMLNLLNETDDNGEHLYGPGFFDLVIIDEAHRSVYAKYGAIFERFDSLLVGLTATPKDEVDHNTYRLFHLEDGVPTDAYPLEDAVADGYLVPARAVAVGTRFLRQGIRYDDLTEEEKDDWDALDWGDDGTPAEVGADAINRFLFNEDTVDQVLGTLMTDGIKVDAGDRIGKTIIFARNRRHAEFIAQRFDLGWPGTAGHFARVITHDVTYADSLIDDFSQPGKAPHIAVSVDMLDTGIDVPDVVNLVFFKPVHSKTKFWQMIGRGTRLRPDLFGPGQDKREFLIFDFCGNLEFFSQGPATAEGSTQKSLTQRLYEMRLSLVTGLDRAQTDRDLRDEVARILHEHVAGMTLDNVIVRPHRRMVERFAEPASWQRLDGDAAEAALALAGLPTTVTDPDVDAKRFDALILRRQLAQLDGDTVTAERIRQTVQAVAESLLARIAIPSVAERAELLEAVAGDGWWVDVTLPMLEVARLRLRSLVRFVEKSAHNPIYTDFEDLLTPAVEIQLPGVTPGTNMERFRAKAAAFLRSHANNVAVERLRRNKQLTPDDLVALETILIDSGAAPTDIENAAQRTGGLGLFVRSLVGLDRPAAAEAFGEFLDGNRYTVDQVRFVILIVDELTANGVMEPARLFESPYTDRAPTGPDFVFPEAQVGQIVEILGSIKAHAVVA